MKKIICTSLVLVILTALSGCGTDTTASTAGSSKPETAVNAAVSTADSGKPETSVNTTASTGENSKPEATDNKASDSSAGQWNKIDKNVTVDGVDYTISAYKKTKESELFSAEDGKTFLLIDMTVKNKNAEEAPLSSITMFELTDADGKVYDISLGGLACLEDEKIEQADGSVAASSEKRCGLGYEVPENAKGFKLDIKELLGDGKQTVEFD